MKKLLNVRIIREKKKSRFCCIMAVAPISGGCER